jgi:polyisoprenoid-binding protein YceI
VNVRNVAPGPPLVRELPAGSQRVHRFVAQACSMTATLTPSRTPTPSRPPRPWYRRRWFVSLAVAVVLLGAAAGGGIWWFLRDDAPDAVDLESATQSLDPVAIDEPAATASDAADAATAVSGTWTVDTSIGEFSYEDSTGTFVGFRVEEELSSIGSTTAVGRTPTVTGSITVDGTTLSAASIEADMTSITTNDSRRDDNVQDALETNEFPTATFTLTQPIDLGDAVNTGAATTVQATGDLTIHGVTTQVTLPLEAQLVDDTIVVVGSLDIDLSTYGVAAPTAPIVVSVSDQATIELQLFFTQS